MKINEITQVNEVSIKGLKKFFGGSGYEFNQTIAGLMNMWNQTVHFQGLDFNANKPQYIAQLNKFIQKQFGGTPDNSFAINNANDVKQYVIARYQEKARGDVEAGGAAPTATPTPAAAPAAFDPNALAKQINDAMASGDLKWNPALRAAVKNLWMRMGGTKAESKNHKGMLLK